MPIQGLKFNIQNNAEAHLSFQATGSFTAYNPNDGYALIALDRTATLLDYDHKLPSQSGGHFPGPINSYLSMRFVDQSGSGVPGQVIVYASADVIQIPQFWSIGRAIQSLVTTLDITQGTQPQNPPANNTRLWVDGNGNLHLLSSTGVDKTVLDTSTPLGADLYGTVPAGHVGVRAGSYVYGYDSVGALHGMLGPTGDNYTQLNSLTNGILFVNAQNSVRLTTITNAGDWTINAGSLTISAGGLYVAGNATVNGTLTVVASSYLSDVYANRGNGTGVYYFATGGTHYIYYTGSSFSFTEPSSFNAAVTVGGALTVNSNQVYIGAAGLSSETARGYAALMTNTGQGDFVLGGGVSILYLHPNLTVGIQQNSPYCDIFGYTYVRSVNGGFMAQNNVFYFANGTANMTFNGTYINMSHSIQFNTTGNQIVWPNGSYISGNAGYVQGSKEALKEDVQEVDDQTLLDRVTDPRMAVVSYHWPEDTRTSLGFTAESVAEVMPNLVIKDEDGSPAGYSPSELTAVVWGSLRLLEKRVRKLELEQGGQQVAAQPIA